MDVTDEAQMEAGVARAAEAFGRLRPLHSFSVPLRLRPLVVGRTGLRPVVAEPLAGGCLLYRLPKSGG